MQEKVQTQNIRLWTPHKNQRKLVNNKARFKVIRCGRRFGKTTYAVNLLVKQALLRERSQFFYVAPTYRQAKMIAWSMLADIVSSLPKALVKKVNESELYVVIGNGSRIDIKGADNPDSLRGVGLDGIVLDEYAFMRPNVWQEIIRPALTDKKGFAIFISTPDGFNHFYDLYLQATNQEDWATFHFTSYDNPLLDPAEIDDASKMITLDRFAQEYMAEFKKKEGLVYKEFIREKHIYNEKKHETVETLAAVDFGYTNPTAVLLIERDPEFNYYVKEEWYKTHKSQEEIIEYCKTSGANMFYADPAEPERIEQMRRAGLNMRDVSKDVSHGISRVQDLLKQNKIYVHKNCKNLISELETYHYKEEQDGRNQDEKPAKDNDHAVDALRYALFMHAPISLSEMDQDFNLYSQKFK